MTDGSDLIANNTLLRAVDNDVRIISFGIGGEFSIFDDIDEEFLEFFDAMEFNFTYLQDISNITQGSAYRATDAGSLRASFTQATLSEFSYDINSKYYVVLFIALLSIAELLLYSRYGTL
ncbi:MAG: hypothetical protein ACMXX9_04645 [Candidatus Woesearchaeota archaeon]